MTKSEYIALCEAQWEKIEKIKATSTLYEHEKQLDAMLVNFGKELLKQSLGALPGDHRQKKSLEPIRSDRSESQK